MGYCENICFQIKELREITEEGGGKALGLKKLEALGLKIPPAVVLVPAGNRGEPDAPVKAYESLGSGTVAVRSSAPNEDGEYHSAAGQFETILNVQGRDEILKAVQICFESDSSRRVESYFSGRNKEAAHKNKGIPVIIQKMIHGKKSGVIFTADPVGHDRDTIIIEAVEGLGEGLVGGKAEGMRYEISKSTGKPQPGNSNGLLGEKEIQELYKGALQAEKEWGCPLDLEWTIDSEGILYWLQSRPITTIFDGSLDTDIGEDELITRCNIGEMLPGAATPLTLSVFVEPLDWGMKAMYRKQGVREKKGEKTRYIHYARNHLFMSLTAMYGMVKKVAGASREALELSILGRVLPPHDIGPDAPGFIRFINGMRYAACIFGHNRSLRKITKMGRTFQIKPAAGGMESLYSELCEKQERVLNKAYLFHYLVSAYSGVMNGILAAVLSGGKDISLEAHGKMGLLLTDIPGIESARLMTDMQAITEAIGKTGQIHRFIEMDGVKAAEWLEQEGGEIGRLYREFMNRHGHRCIREAELRSRDYETYPEELTKIIREQLKIGTPDKHTAPSAPAPDNGQKKKVSPWLLKKAKEGVRQREFSKSMLILTQHQFKKGYRKLAALMTSSGMIPDPDLIYFFTKEEIGTLISDKEEIGNIIEGGRSESCILQAEYRRRELPYQMDLRFPEVSRGKPEPREETIVSGSEKLFKGTPVSSGIVEGKIRIVKQLETAYDLEPDEIMVAPFTDVGWTPFFSIVSGLVTEIGGALSHGAVVAREYGLPMVSNVSNATSLLETGMRIRLDGKSGIIKILSSSRGN